MFVIADVIPAEVLISILSAMFTAIVILSVFLGKMYARVVKIETQMEYLKKETKNES